MRISDIIRLDEKTVDSSWIRDVRYERKPKTQDGKRSRAPAFSDVLITVADGRRYTVHGVPYKLYRQWVTSPSQGQFWHKFIKNQYQVT